MHNFKHTIAAMLSVVLIGSLAVSQAAGITAANANRTDANYGDDILAVSDAASQDAQVVSITDAQPTEKKELTPEEIKEIKENLEFVSGKDFGMIYEDAAFEEVIPFKPVAGYVITTTGGLNVRAGESLNSEILESLTYGQMIDIIGESEEWYTIPYGEDGGVAYVLKEFVTTSYDEAKEVLLGSGVMYESGVVNVEGGSLNVRSGAGTEGTVVIDQITDGDNIIVLDRVNDEWIKVYYGNNYSTGYVMAQYVHIAEMVARDKVAKDRIARINAISEDGVFVINSNYVNCRQMPTENSGVIKTFKNGEKCLIVSEGSEWTKIAFGSYRATGYVKSEFVITQSEYDARIKANQKKAATKKASSTKAKAKSSGNANPAPSSKGQAIVNTAAKYIGVRYVYGGTSPKGFDCSGLVQYVCRQNGISVNRTSRSQYSNGVPVSKSNLQAGDLVFFSKGNGISHVGIYAGGGQVIHAPSPGKKVCYIALSKICSYSTYVGARRVY